MQIMVLGNDALKEELLAQGLREDVALQVINEPRSIPNTDVYIDLLFDNTPTRTEALKQLQPATIIVNAVINTPALLPAYFIRINGWPTFLRRTVIEAACNDASSKTKAEKIFSCFNKTVEWVPDVPGFISARVISTIINEAYFSVQDQVSTREEIDTAMKWGTNYPYGPFEWARQIGLKNIHGLLSVLSQQHSRYEPATLLKQEAIG